MNIYNGHFCPLNNSTPKLNEIITMTSRQQRAAQNREELLEAAVQVFRTHGINAPLQQVIDAAKCRTGDVLS